MVKKYRPWLFSVVFYTVAVMGLTMLIVLIYNALMGFQSAEYFRTLSNILFFEGALVLTFGAFVEFFVGALSHRIARSMMMPYELLSKRFALEEKDAGFVDEESSGGWMLIAIGVVIIIASAAFAYISMK